jgi:hypothetical protein
MMLLGLNLSFRSSWRPLVLGQQLALLLLGGLPQPHRLGDHRGDDLQDAHVLLERDLLGEQPVRRDRAQHLVADLDGDADEGDVLLAESGAGARAVEELRLLGDPGDHGGLAALDDLAGDAFAQPVAPLLLLAFGEPVGGVDRDVPGFPVHEGHGPADHLHVVRQGLQDRPDHLAEIHATVQDLADLDEQLKLLELPLDRRQARGFRHEALSSPTVREAGF